MNHGNFQGNQRQNGFNRNRSRSPPDGRMRNRSQSPGRNSNRRRDNDPYEPYTGPNATGRGRQSRPDQGLLTDPAKLDFLVAKRYYADWLRQEERGKGNRWVPLSDEEFQRRYDDYREQFRIRDAKKFAEAHKDEEWFRIRYHPQESKAHHHFIGEKIKKPLLEKFKHELDAGVFDDANFDEKVGDSFLTCWQSPEDASDAFHKLSVKTIPAKVTALQFKKEIEHKLDKDGIVQFIHFSEPFPSRGFQRLAWIDLKPEECQTLDQLTKYAEQLQNLKLADEELQFLPHAMQVSRPRMQHIAFSEPDQIKLDLANATQLAHVLDTEYGLGNASHIVEERANKVCKGHNWDPNSVEAIKKHLDMLITYLRRVQLFDYYSGFICDSVEDFSRRNHVWLRRKWTPDTPPNDGTIIVIDKHNHRIKYSAGLLSPQELAKLDVISPEKQQEEVMRTNMIVEAENKHRCAIATCSKLFKGSEFLRKHLLTKHPELFANIQQGGGAEIDMLNHFARDPCKVALSKDDQSKLAALQTSHLNENLPNRPNRLDRSRPFERKPPTNVFVDPRRMRNYKDLDAVVTPVNDAEISYE